MNIASTKEVQQLKDEVARLRKKVTEQRELIDRYQADTDPVPPPEYAWPSVPQLWFMLLSMDPPERHRKLQMMLEAVQLNHSMGWWAYRVETTMLAIDGAMNEAVNALTTSPA